MHNSSNKRRKNELSRHVNADKLYEKQHVFHSCDAIIRRNQHRQRYQPQPNIDLHSIRFTNHSSDAGAFRQSMFKYLFLVPMSSDVSSKVFEIFNLFGCKTEHQMANIVCLFEHSQIVLIPKYVPGMLINICMSKTIIVIDSTEKKRPLNSKSRYETVCFRCSVFVS